MHSGTLWLAYCKCTLSPDQTVVFKPPSNLSPKDLAENQKTASWQHIENTQCDEGKMTHCTKEHGIDIWLEFRIKKTPHRFVLLLMWLISKWIKDICCGFNCILSYFQSLTCFFFLHLTLLAREQRAYCMNSLHRHRISPFTFISSSGYDNYRSSLLCTRQMTLLPQRTIQNRIMSGMAKRFWENTDLLCEPCTVSRGNHQKHILQTKRVLELVWAFNTHQGSHPEPLVD